MGLGDTTQIGLGVTVGILSTSVQSLGLTLQRKSHILEDDRPSRRPPHRRRRWQIGMLLFIVSNILGSSIQITTLPLIILSPLQASGLVFNSICATLILSEPFTRHSLVGTVLVCIGAGLIAAFGALKEPAHSLDGLLELLSRKPFLLWMGAQAFVIVGILAAAKMARRVSPRTKNTVRMKMLRGISYGAVSGILSADCLLLAKSASELLVRTIVDRVNQFNRWQSWIILLGLVFLALTQLFYLHRGLKLCSTSVLYPVVFCIYNIVAILDGLIYYRQASRLPALHSGLIALGVVVLLSGVLCLSWRLQDENTVQPARTGSALTPGLGFVDTDDEYGSSGPEEEFLDDDDDDDDATDEYDDGLPPSLPSPPLVRKADGSFLASPGGRRRALSQAEEIWGELQDEDEAISPRAGRVIGGGAAMDERTSLLLKPPGRRKTSYGFPRVGSSAQARRLRQHAQQAATGGWWKLKWWKRRRGRDGGSGGGPAEEDDEMA